MTSVEEESISRFEVQGLLRKSHEIWIVERSSPFYVPFYVGVSKNRGKTPKSSKFKKVFPYKPSILGLSPIFGNTHVGNKGWLVSVF